MTPKTVGKPHPNLRLTHDSLNRAARINYAALSQHILILEVNMELAVNCLSVCHRRSVRVDLKERFQETLSAIGIILTKERRKKRCASFSLPLKLQLPGTKRRKCSELRTPG
jgi:hypothetical protein